MNDLYSTASERLGYLLGKLERSMNELKCLPQDTVRWGEHILSKTIANLGEFGINRPITFTVEPLLPLYRSHVEPNMAGSVGAFLNLPPHVPDFAVRAALDACVSSDAQSIIALGGGSVLDAAKAVSHFYHLEYGRYLPIVALPTTLSGSEFSHYFGITETDKPQKFKRSYAVKGTTPRLVVIDPVLIGGTPRQLLLSSAIKGLDHAIEGMRKVGTDHPHSILAASGVQRFLSVLERWPQEIETAAALEARKITSADLLQLQLGAWQCYFYPASVIYGLSHRIGHILGGTYGLPHSVTSCITLAPVIRQCASYYGSKLDIFARAQGDSSAADVLASRIDLVVKSLGLPNRISEFDFKKEELAQVASLLTANYPNEVADLGDGAPGKLVALLESIW